MPSTIILVQKAYRSMNFEVFIKCRLIVQPNSLHEFDTDMKKVKAIIKWNFFDMKAVTVHPSPKLIHILLFTHTDTVGNDRSIKYSTRMWNCISCKFLWGPLWCRGKCVSINLIGCGFDPYWRKLHIFISTPWCRIKAWL